MLMGWLSDALPNHLFGRNSNSIRGTALMFDRCHKVLSIDSKRSKFSMGSGS